MSDEESLLEHGYEAVLRGAEQNDGELNVDVLAQACAWRAHTSSTPQESLGWARAAIVCYRKTAERRTAGWDRQGSEVSLFGVMQFMILKWGAEVGSDVLDPENVRRWIQEEVDRQESLGAFRDALGTGKGSAVVRAICLKERLGVGLALFEKGLLPSSLSQWFKTAGLLREG